MTSENVQKGIGKVYNTDRGLLLIFFVTLSNISSLGDEVAEKVSCLLFPKLSELIMFVVGVSIDEGFPKCATCGSYLDALNIRYLTLELVESYGVFLVQKGSGFFNF